MINVLYSLSCDSCCAELEDVCEDRDVLYGIAADLGWLLTDELLELCPACATEFYLALGEEETCQ